MYSSEMLCIVQMEYNLMRKAVLMRFSDDLLVSETKFLY